MKTLQKRRQSKSALSLQPEVRSLGDHPAHHLVPLVHVDVLVRLAEVAGEYLLDRLGDSKTRCAAPVVTSGEAVHTLHVDVRGLVRVPVGGHGNERVCEVEA